MDANDDLVGQQCFACPSGPGAPSGPMNVEKRLVDGTYVVMPVGATSFLDRWEGVTRAELSVDDRARWPAAFARLTGGGAGLDRAQAGASLSALGYEVPPEQLAAVWPDVDVLDEEAAYAWFTRFGYGAQLFVAPPPPPHEQLYTFYWNSVRMGGRDPADVGRAITLSDTLAALGLSESATDPAASSAIDAFEQANGLRVPERLRALWSVEGATIAICDRHPNNPVPLEVAAWTARAAAPATQRSHAIHIMNPHQGDHTWWAVFDDGEEDASIWLELGRGAPLRRCAGSSAFFFWDLAETGRASQAWDDERRSTSSRR